MEIWVNENEMLKLRNFGQIDKCCHTIFTSGFPLVKMSKCKFNFQCYNAYELL